MLKKIFIAAFIMALAIMKNVSAQEVLVYNDKNYDYKFYVITESIVNRTMYRDNRTFDVLIRIYCQENFDSDVLYQMWENDGLIWYTNGEGTGMHSANGVQSAQAIWNYCLKFLNLDYEINYK